MMMGLREWSLTEQCRGKALHEPCHQSIQGKPIQASHPLRTFSFRPQFPPPSVIPPLGGDRHFDKKSIGNTRKIFFRLDWNCCYHCVVQPPLPDGGTGLTLGGDHKGGGGVADRHKCGLLHPSDPNDSPAW